SLDAGAVGVTVLAMRQVPGPVDAEVAGKAPAAADRLDDEVGAVAAGGAVYESALAVGVGDDDHDNSPSLSVVSPSIACGSWPTRRRSRCTRSSSSRNIAPMAR